LFVLKISSNSLEETKKLIINWRESWNGDALDYFSKPRSFPFSKK
jgi:hypothetical protein